MLTTTVLCTDSVGEASLPFGLAGSPSRHRGKHRAAPDDVAEFESTQFQSTSAWRSGRQGDPIRCVCVVSRDR